MPSDYDQLVEMGFDPERARIAVAKTGGLQGALEWLEENQDKSLEEIKAAAQPDQDEPPALKPGEEARSLVCNECGKRFRSQAQAEFHASKTEHVDFSESTEEMAPLTEEEKAAKLQELREKLAEKRARQSEQDKAERKRNEEIRRKSTKETQDIKEELQKKERLKEAAQKKREKQEEIKAKAHVKAQIEADKAARREKAERERAEREGRSLQPATTAPPTAATAAAVAPATSKPTYDKARLRLEIPGKSVEKEFSPKTLLSDVAAALSEEHGIEVQSFTQVLPRKVFKDGDFKRTLEELGLVSPTRLIVG